MMEIIAAEKSIERELKKNEYSLRELYDNIKCTNTPIIGVPKGEERERERERKDLRKYLKRE